MNMVVDVLKTLLNKIRSKYNDLSKLKKILLIIIGIYLTSFVNYNLILPELVILSVIALKNGIKDKRILKIIISGVCLVISGILFISVYSDLYMDYIASKNNNISTSITKYEEDAEEDTTSLIEYEEDAEEDTTSLIEYEEDTKEDTTSSIEYERDITYEIELTADRIIRNEISDSITNTTLDILQVNENLGTDSTDDVVVLGYFTWTTKNLEKMTREMLKIYSDHLAAKLASELADGSEIALFWDAEYTGLNIKHSYYVINGNAYIQ